MTDAQEKLVDDMWEMLGSYKPERGKRLVIEVSYASRDEAAFPIVLEFDGELFEIPTFTGVAGAIGYHICVHGLTQATLWDAYYLAREEVYVNDIRMDGYDGTV